MSILIVKVFLTRPIEHWREICVLGENNFEICFWDPQEAHPCAKRRHLTYWSWKSVQGSWL